MSVFRSLLMASEKLIPDKYQRVEYIQSNGNQYIETSYYPNINTEVIMDFVDNDETRFENYFGTDANFRFQRYAYSSNFQWMCGNSNINGSIDVTYRRQLRYNKNGIYNEKDVVLISNPVNAINKSYSMVIFNAYYGGLDAGGAYKLYDFKIYESGELIHHYIPCYRKNDGVIGLYDAIGKAFLTNQGSGTFIKGGDV